MKKAMRVWTAAVLVLSCLLCLGACGEDKKEQSNEKFGLWKNAKYVSDTELGDGATTLTVQVKAEDHQITFTIHTDKATVGEALQEHGLLEGEDSEYGLFIKKVNGILADYDVDQTYWGFFIDGEYAMTGVDSTNIEEGVTYCLARTK